MMRWVMVAILVLLAVQARAGETLVHLARPVSDADFHRALACGALPGGKCRQPLIRWGQQTRRDLRVALLPAEAGFDQTRARLVGGAVDRAMAQINAVGADLRLRRVGPGEKPHVRIRMSALREGQRTRGIDGVPDGWQVEAASFHVYTNADHRITRGTILISTDIDLSAIESVLLEELVQSLGLPVDIEGPAYADRSIFDQNSNRVTRLTGQDAAAIHLHYPPR